ncbi:TetR/AcrR family transcriptional regulator [Agromyces protaetiae]|uniref:TetR/AcrR family transcriptional regulator n=1 Tax=Agromyces protaetiae TaxID=2509455 RepID=A0A4P6FEI6_9MICO|nr:TetR/AcrR family transcriptional regulator [Agromyces protaetiae]QAY74344.1 TetR/AcrR family transcriptional regulator [Agromyces protaetiae]
MPAPERTTLPTIVAAASGILDRDGLDGLTMQAVATAVGVRAPSLYKRVRSRDELIRLVAESVAADLGAALDRAEADSSDPRAAVVALAEAARAFAHERPRAYKLLFASLPDAARPGRAALDESARAVLAVAGGLAGEAHALEAARTLTAWLNGFVLMELSGDFRLGGDLDAAFEFGAERLARALER